MDLLICCTGLLSLVTKDLAIITRKFFHNLLSILAASKKIKRGLEMNFKIKPTNPRYVQGLSFLRGAIVEVIGISSYLTAAIITFTHYCIILKFEIINRSY